MEVNTNYQDIIIKQEFSNNFEFTLGPKDTIFVLSGNCSINKVGFNNIISKIFITKESRMINLDDVGKMLNFMGIEKLQIFSINNSNSTTINKIGVKGYDLLYLDINKELFINQILNSNHRKFIEYNNTSLYILRDGNFLDIKNLFAKVDGYQTNIGRGGSQRSHVISPLEFRFSNYLITLFRGDCNLISSLNAFNNMTKDRYLSYTNKYYKPYKSITINND